MWLDGRLNGLPLISGITANALSFVIWFIAYVMLFVQQLFYVAPAKRQTFYMLVIVICSPWFLCLSIPTGTQMLSEGFKVWACRNIDKNAILTWVESSGISNSPTPVPYWWPTEEAVNLLGTPVSEGLLPEEIAKLRPTEVWIIDQGVLMVWQNKAVLPRYGYITRDQRRPEFFRADTVEWSQPMSGVFISVFAHP